MQLPPLHDGQQRTDETACEKGTGCDFEDRVSPPS